jgi:formate/nitrite transporter FocA (FNT family)
MKRVTGLILYAILAGFCISLGGTVFLRLKDTFPGSTVVGALFFTIGLFTVCTRGYYLYTGRLCYLFDSPFPAYLFDLILIWIGNLIGCMLLSFLESLTTMFGSSGIHVVAADMVTNKMHSSYLSLSEF